MSPASFRPAVRRHLLELPAYTPIEPFEVLSRRVGRQPSEIVKLDANENPYGPSPSVRSALANLEFPHIYPDPESRLLRAALAEFTGVPAENLLAGAGADELIDLLMRVFVEPGEAVLSCPPSFGMYPFDTRLNAGQVIEVSRRPDFSLDLPAVQEAVERYAPKLLFLASPNNPDGSLATPREIEALLALPVLLVLDEAYIEFSDPGSLGSCLSYIRQAPQRENLVVLRTFSKWAGLAGLRVGYGAFPGWLMPVLWNSKQPYNVSVAASTAAIGSIGAAGELKSTVQTLCSERERLWSGLQSVPYLQPYPTRANFILCRVAGRSAAELKARLASEWGIFIRYFSTPALQDHVRVSVGRPQDTDRLLSALHAMETADQP